jgi:serine/threonine-protein kinase
LPERSAKKRDTPSDPARKGVVDSAGVIAAGTSAPELASCKHCGKYHPQEVLRCPSTDLLLELRGRVLDSKFRLIKRLGLGGMAEVWLARNEAVDRRVAIKFLRLEVIRNEESVRRFRTEAKAAGRIRSRHVVEVLDFGSSVLGPYIVMEWLRGRDLAEWVEEEGRLAIHDAVWVARRILMGLGDAHAAGVLHRDLKPANVFVHQEESGELVVKLMDFGVARFMDRGDEGETAVGTMLGTPEYMAPEQLSAPHEVDERADIWGVGAILYRILSGERVFSGGNLEDVMQAVLTAKIPPIAELRPEIPRGLADFVHGCLQRDRNARPASAVEAAAALAAYELEGASPGRIIEASQNFVISTRVPALAPPRPRRRIGLWMAAATVIFGLAGALRAWSSGMLNLHQLDEPDHVRASALVDEPEADRALAQAKSGAEFSPDVEPSEVLASEERDAVPALASHSKSPHDVIRSAAEPEFASPPLEHHVKSLHEHDGFKRSSMSTRAATNSAGDRLEALPDISWDTLPENKTQSEANAAGAGAKEVSESRNSKSSGQQRESAAPGSRELSSPKDGDSTRNPVGTIRVGSLWVLQERAPFMEQWQAKNYCEELAKVGHLGQYTWHLPNPSEAQELVGHREVARSRYWTSAAWRGKAKVIFLPSGRMWSLKTSRSLIRPLCLVRSK